MSRPSRAPESDAGEGSAGCFRPEGFDRQGAGAKVFRGRDRRGGDAKA